MQPDDAEAVGRLLTSLSPISAYRRFLGSSRGACAAYLSRLRSPSQTLAATVALEHGALVGIASLHPENVRGAAEVALAVADDDQGEGIGTLLLEHLVDDAQGLGLQRMTATVLTDNAAMMTVFRDLGLTMAAGHADAGVIDISLDLSVSDAYAERVAERNLTSSAASYRRAMHPEAVVVMHDARGRKAARRMRRHLSNLGYAGPVTVRESHLPVPAHTDLAVLCGLPRSVGRMVSACAEADVAAVLWPQAPFVTQRDQESLRKACARAGLLLLGPASRVRKLADPAGLLAAGASDRADRDGGGIVVVGARPEHLLTVLERHDLEVGAVLDLSWEDLPDWSGAVVAALLEAGTRAVVVCRPPLAPMHWPPSLLNAVRQAGTLVVSLVP
ncbi:MAG TPA: GNAT family N-acetyltransferase, partial [Pedococcus sp.]|nr:GNAT family N-acetyltransferase [Pedococcus sp.]